MFLIYFTSLAGCEKGDARGVELIGTGGWASGLGAGGLAKGEGT